jgi:hypothetical protein
MLQKIQKPSPSITIPRLGVSLLVCFSVLQMCIWAKFVFIVSSPYPQLELSEGLQVPSDAKTSGADIISATLHTWGAKPIIVFDGTYDGMIQTTR